MWQDAMTQRHNQGVKRLLYMRRSNGINHSSFFFASRWLLHWAKIRFLSMCAAWVNNSQGIWCRFTRPDGADSVLSMHHFLHTTNKLSRRQFPEQRGWVSYFHSLKFFQLNFWSLAFHLQNSWLSPDTQCWTEGLSKANCDLTSCVTKRGKTNSQKAISIELKAKQMLVNRAGSEYFRYLFFQKKKRKKRDSIGYFNRYP